MTQVKFFSFEEENYVQGAKRVSFQHDSAMCPSYKLVQTASLSACQVAWHINELEAKIEEWFKQFTEKMNQSKAHSLLSKERKVIPLSGNKTDQVTSTELCIEGVQLDATEGDPLRALYQEARSILSKVNDLIERLDTDREEVENVVKKEKQQVSSLRKKIDALSLWWIQKLPQVVQKEHEICAQDLCELQWHITSKKCQISCIQNKITTTEIINQNVEDDVNYFKKNSPLLKEKMKLEDKLAERAEDEVNKVTETLTNVHQKLKESKQNLDDAISEANFERAVLQGQLDNLNEQLLDLGKELRTAENLLDNFFNQESKTKNKLKEDEILSNTLQEKASSLKIDAVNLETTIQDWKDKSAETKSDARHQQSICHELHQAIKRTKNSGEAEMWQNTEKYSELSKELEDILMQNITIQSEIDILSEKIKQSQDMKDKNAIEIRVHQEHIQNNNEQRHHLREQLTQVARLHNKVKIKMEQTKVEIKMQEQRSKIHIENLKRKIREETGARIKLQAKVQLDNAELDEFQNNANMKSASVTKSIKQAEKIVASAEARFKKIVDEHEKLYTDYVTINSTYNKLQKRHKFMKEHLSKRNNHLQAKLTSDMHKFKEASSELDYSLRRIMFLEERLRGFISSKSEITNMLGKTNEMIVQLRRNLNTTQFKFMNAQDIVKYLEKEFAETKKRQKMLDEDYHKLILQRRETLRAMNVKLINASQENTFLAEKYRRLQNTFLIAKSLLLEIYEERICTELTFEDYKQANTVANLYATNILQTAIKMVNGNGIPIRSVVIETEKELSLLESWMQKAIVEYFKRLGLYSQSVLAKLLAVSQENAKKIITVQGKLSGAIQQVSTFLLSLSEDSLGSESISNKQCIHHCVNEDKKSEAVQVTV